MSLFRSKKPSVNVSSTNSQLAELALRTIHDGVIMTNRVGQIQFINPAAILMTNCHTAENVYGLDYGLLIKIETKEGRELSEDENPLIHAMRTGQPLDSYECCMISSPDGKRTPVAINVLVAEGSDGRIITMRDITKELAEEGEQTEFISTASHEMRTPVASIEGYLSLALNPQTATIDERARGYLVSAHAASQHLGRLFHDLLDVTKLDDGRIKPQFTPAEMVGEVKKIADDYLMRFKEANLSYRFGSSDPNINNARAIPQVVYSFVDLGFMREIMDNLIDNAIKYTPEGGSIYIGVRGDGDRVLINVTDTGMGISPSDIGHIFQKFYRADNSDTRTVGGTGLGLYLAKQRVEAMGGRIWAESAFGEGSTFYVSLPRLTGEEYEKRMIAVKNAMMSTNQTQAPQPAPRPTMQPQLVIQSQSMQPRLVAQPAPVAPVSRAPQPVSPPIMQPAPQIAPQPIQTQPINQQNQGGRQ